MALRPGDFPLRSFTYACRPVPPTTGDTAKAVSAADTNVQSAIQRVFTQPKTSGKPPSHACDPRKRESVDVLRVRHTYRSASARSTAASTCSRVVGKAGTGQSSGPIRSSISVHPRMTPCAPRSTAASMIRR